MAMRAVAVLMSKIKTTKMSSDLLHAIDRRRVGYQRTSSKDLYCVHDDGDDFDYNDDYGGGGGDGGDNCYAWCSD